MITRRHTLVLAIYPNTRGFAFVLFEGPLAPVDWAAVEVRRSQKNEACMRRIKKLLDQYLPDAVVVQRMGEGGTRRARRIQALNRQILVLAETVQIKAYAFTREDVRRTFSYLGIVNKQTIAETLAKHIPALERYLPPPRKIWKSEDPRMGLFEAAALTWCFFQQ